MAGACRFAAQDHYDYADGRRHADRINLNPSVESVGWPGFTGDALKRTVWGKILAAAEDRPVSRVARSSKLRHPLTRVVFFVLCMLSLFHGAHRFRYTLYDGLQIKHLNEVINPLCYGGALVGSLWAGYLLLQVT